MRRWVAMLVLLSTLILPVSAVEITAPTVPQSGWAYMPKNTESFSEGLLELLGKALAAWRGDLTDAARISLGVISSVLLVSCLRAWKGTESMILNLAGAAAVSAVMLTQTNAMILLAGETVAQMSEYGKLLLPVMTAALAAQGGITASTGLYIGTAFFDALLGSMLSCVLVPLIHCFLALAMAGSVCGEDVLKKLRDLLKNAVSWILKTLLTVFTTYMGITGVVSGTTDAAVLKATKVTISSVVPVVGGILSDASEAVLVGTGVMKNTAGIYGIFAVLALFLAPFLRIGIHYLVLKLTAALCTVFGSKDITGLIDDYASAMGLLLGITGAMCCLLLVSTGCFLKDSY